MDASCGGLQIPVTDPRLSALMACLSEPLGATTPEQVFDYPFADVKITVCPSARSTQFECQVVRIHYYSGAAEDELPVVFTDLKQRLVGVINSGFDKKSDGLHQIAQERQQLEQNPLVGYAQRAQMTFALNERQFVLQRQEQGHSPIRPHSQVARAHKPAASQRRKNRQVAQAVPPRAPNPSRKASAPRDGSYADVSDGEGHESGSDGSFGDQSAESNGDDEDDDYEDDDEEAAPAAAVSTAVIPATLSVTSAASDLAPVAAGSKVSKRTPYVHAVDTMPDGEPIAFIGSDISDTKLPANIARQIELQWKNITMTPDPPRPSTSTSPRLVLWTRLEKTRFVEGVTMHIAPELHPPLTRMLIIFLYKIRTSATSADDARAIAGRLRNALVRKCWLDVMYCIGDRNFLVAAAYEQALRDKRATSAAEVAATLTSSSSEKYTPSDVAEIALALCNSTECLSRSGLDYAATSCRLTADWVD